MKHYFFALFFIPLMSLRAQVILNAYAKISAVSNSSVLTLINVNQTNHTFNAGEKVIVMQMQDDVIGTNTVNNSTFGTLSSIANAGNYEVKTILSRLPATGTPTSITLSSILANTYNTGTNSSVQLITFRYLGNNFTSTANITALGWDGNVGGVIGIEVNNIFTLNHNINADGLGFAGGAKSANADEACTASDYSLNDANKGYKGEGIYKSTAASQQNARARIINGGGGGSENNSGGGGGGNFTSGGNGGYGYQCTSANSGYGLGGVTLSTSISGSRIFMGGGGGGGQQNNSVGTNGGNGGGIILIKATSLVTTTTCSGGSVSISANGLAAANSGNDGSGGGGAGGTILLQVASFSVTTACPMINSGNGGNGGNVTDPASHGGGGGGGQGVVIYSIPQPSTNITTSVTNGSVGSDSSGGNTSGTGGGGTSGAGVVTASSTPLPVELTAFYGEIESRKVKLFWSAATEKNNAYFTVQRSEDGINFTAIASVNGAGTSSSYHSYQQYDNSPYSGLSYYRLKQTDISLQYKYSPIISVNFDEKIEFSISPNPVASDESVIISMDSKYAGKSATLHFYDLTGKELVSKSFNIADERELKFNLTEFNLQKGIYFLKLENPYSDDYKKLIVK